MPERAVAITFDDGHVNNREPIEHLLEHGLRASVYLTTGTRDGHATLDPRQLDALAHDPEQVEIGAHSVTHPRLDELTPASIATEVRTSKAQLEQLLGREVSSFAYPYGCYDRWVRHAVIQADYRSAVAVKNALSHTDDDPWAIARFTVRKDTSAADIARILEGEGIRRAWSGERARTRAYRSARRLRRHLRHTTPSLLSTPAGAAILPGIPERAVGAFPQETQR
jgi:peptidoglycan/xylan/chitin deacetylase (PgdA/CDA1 family)